MANETLGGRTVGYYMGKDPLLMKGRTFYSPHHSVDSMVGFRADDVVVSGGAVLVTLTETDFGDGRHPHEGHVDKEEHDFTKARGFWDYIEQQP